MRSHRRIRNLTAKPRAQACKPHRFKSFNTDGSLSQATACSNHGHLDLESRARLFTARAATAAQSQPEHRECNPQGRLSCSSQYSIYLDISRYVCQILSRVAPIGSWGGWAWLGDVGRLVLLLAVASCTAPPAPLTSENKSNKKSVLAPWPATSCDPRMTGHALRHAQPANRVVPAAQPASHEPRPAPREVTPFTFIGFC